MNWKQELEGPIRVSFEALEKTFYTVKSNAISQVWRKSSKYFLPYHYAISQSRRPRLESSTP
jgi:hypothetical protein